MTRQDNPDDAVLRRYLLGDSLSAEEIDTVEQRYFLGDEYLDHVSALEDDLIDAYIRGDLAPLDRALFESHFLGSKRRRDRLEATQAITAGFFRRTYTRTSFLKGVLELLFAQSPVNRTVFIGLAAATVATVCFVGADDTRLRSQSREIRRPHVVNVPSASLPAEFPLHAGLLRSGSGEGNRIRLAPGSKWIVLQLETAAAQHYSSFVAVLSAAGGSEIARETHLTASGDSIDFMASAGALTPGEDYSVTLSGLDSSGAPVALPSYAFHVLK